MINIKDCEDRTDARTGSRTDVKSNRSKPDHSELAMRAAKRMSRSSHKEKTGRIICRHLLEMLAEKECDLQVNRVRRYLAMPFDLKYSRSPDTSEGFLEGEVEGKVKEKVVERQISLSL